MCKLIVIKVNDLLWLNIQQNVNVEEKKKQLWKFSLLQLYWNTHIIQNKPEFMI